MTSVYVTRQPSVDGDARAQEALHALLARLRASAGDAPAAELLPGPGSPDARARLTSLGGGLSALVYELEPSAGRPVAVVAGVWPDGEVRELAVSRVLQLSPVNGLPEFAPASSAEDAAEQRASTQGFVRDLYPHLAPRALGQAGAYDLTSVDGGAGPLSSGEQSETERAEAEAQVLADAEWAAAVVHAKAEAEAAGTPIDDAEGEWVGVHIGDGPFSVGFVSHEESRRYAEEEAERFVGVTGGASQMEVELRLGLPGHVLTPAWAATSQEELDAVVAGCENEWHRIVLSRMIDQPDVGALMAELAIETVLVPVDREPTEEERQRYQLEYAAVMDRWDVGDFVDEPEAPWLSGRIEPGAAAGDSEIVASFEHPLAKRQFERVP